MILSNKQSEGINYIMIADLNIWLSLAEGLSL